MNRSKTFVDEALGLYYSIEALEASNYAKWRIISSYSYVLTVLLSYLIFVFIIGPRMMKNAQPLNVAPLMLLYNFVQIIFNAYLFTKVSRYLYAKLSEGVIQCINLETYGSNHYDEIHFLMWMAVINKSLDLLDTIFFVLRKKWSHLSFLHVYHHVLTFGGIWCLARYAPGGMIVVFGFMNAFVHCVMYSYYFMAGCPFFGIKNYARYLRKPTTQLQITQFTIAGIHGIWSLTDEKCTYSKELICFGLIQDAVMIILFSKFYIKTYFQSKKQVDNEIIR